MKHTRHIPKPRWLKQNLVTGPGFEQTRELLRQKGLTTVCSEARCPNIRECFSRHRATFLIMGGICTRNCRFCAVEQGQPEPPAGDEAQRVAEAAFNLNLDYVVVTSVTRDDLPDGGASHFAATIAAVRFTNPGTKVEVLVPDFMGDLSALSTVLEAEPVVINHNIETVSRLYPAIRNGADYFRSLGLLETAARRGTIPVKTGLMLGLGESEQELRQAFIDVRNAGTRILTLGQYLQPAPDKIPVSRYVPPDEFDHWKNEALSMGFAAVASGPFVRSSYDASGLCDVLRMD